MNREETNLGKAQTQDEKQHEGHQRAEVGAEEEPEGGDKLWTNHTAKQHLREERKPRREKVRTASWRQRCRSAEEKRVG